ncbi:MAG: ABC transporter permease [Proteobacteria bacterium]|nr:ABC transporter permease [Pseudomonadota bacterium]
MSVCLRCGVCVSCQVNDELCCFVSSFKFLVRCPTKQSPCYALSVPIPYIVMLALPILTLLADYVGLLGAMLVVKLEFNISYSFFYAKILETITLSDLFTGMAKTIVFAFFISISACWKGLNTEGGTQGVGQTTTWVVVTSSIFIMIADFFLTKFFIITVFPRY